jgi:hypothetical protein
LLNLPDAEYQRCAPPDHIAAGSTTTDDGRPMSISVEEVGGSLVVQHYVAETHEAQHCHMVSLSDLQTPAAGPRSGDRDLSVTALDADTCQYQPGDQLPHPSLRRHARGGAKLRTGSRESARSRHRAQSTRGPRCTQPVSSARRCRHTFLDGELPDEVTQLQRAAVFYADVVGLPQAEIA